MELRYQWFWGLLVASFTSVFACQCGSPEPLKITSLSVYDVIFYGKVVEISEECTEQSKVVFEIQEQYFGDVEKAQEVIYDCSSECGMAFSVGDEWIIYAQRNNYLETIVSLCSRSRKFFESENEDFYQYSLGNTFQEELTFLQSNFEVNQSFDEGLKPLKYEKVPVNYIPWLLGSSMLFMLIGYIVFKRLTSRGN